MLDPLRESETVLLSIAMNYPDTAHDIITDVPIDAFTGDHLEIYRAILRVVADGGTPDLLSVMGHVKGKSRLAEITSASGSPAQIPYHSGRLMERLRRIRLSRLAESLVESVADASKTTGAITEELEATLTALQTAQTESYIDSRRLGLMLSTHLEQCARGETSDGHRTGYHDLDQLLGGLRPQELVILGARPSIGKTALALNMAWNLAKKGIKVGFFSSEMSSLQLGKRLLAVCSGVGIRQARSGLNRTANNAVFEIGDSGALFINDTPNIPLQELVRDARLMKRKDAVQVIMVDYLSLITYDHRTMAGWEKLGEISKRLKQLARELDCPVVALSQVGRDSEGKEPTLADLRYSGAIEQDADVVAFIHRERLAEVEHIETDIIIAKNRNGEVGKCKLIFVPAQTRFFSMERDR
jgi:replicative DNA helicase